MQEVFIENGKYSVTDDGEVYSYVSGIRVKMVGGFTGANKNYKVVTISDNGKCANRFVHRLVASAFIPNPKEYPQINHIDGNPKNNHVSNLEWCDNSRNSKHAYDIGLHEKYQCLVCGVRLFGGKDRCVCGKCKSAIVFGIESALRASHKAGRYSKLSLEKSAPSDVVEFLKLKASGYSFSEIARKYGCTRQNIQGRIATYAKSQNLATKGKCQVIELMYGKYVPVCDDCGETLPPEDEYPDAINAENEKGWKRRRYDEDEYEHRCPDCQ